jgi:hypothetical protein
LVRQGYENVEQLDEDELFRFGLYVGGMMTEYDNAYYQYRVGLLDESRWRLTHSQLEFILQPPGVKRWLLSGHIPGVLSPEFAALVDEILGEEPDRGE